jgi:hypothetical protein
MGCEISTSENKVDPSVKYVKDCLKRGKLVFVIGG